MSRNDESAKMVIDAMLYAVKNFLRLLAALAGKRA